MSVSLSVAVAKAKSISELNALVEKGTAQVSIWGNSVIAVKGKGSVYIDTVAERILKIVEANINYSEKDRAAGKKLVEKIKRSYEKTARDSQKLNGVTWLFYTVINWYMKNLQNWGYGIRFYWKDTTLRIFEYYTAKRFLEIFGEDHQISDVQEFRFGQPLYSPATNSEYSSFSPKQVRELREKLKQPPPRYLPGVIVPDRKLSWSEERMLEDWVE